MSVSDNNKRIAKNTSLLYVRMAVVMCVQLYTSRVILNALGAADYGIYGVVGGLVVLFSSLNGSLGSSTSRFFTVELGRNAFSQLKKVFSTAVAIHLTMALIVLVLAETIGLWFLSEKMIIPEDRMTAAFVVFQLSVVSSLISVTQVPYNAAIIAHEHMNVYAYVGLFEAFGMLVVAFLIKVAPFDRLIWYALLIFLIRIIVMIFYRWYCLHHFEESHFTFQRDKKLYKGMLSYALFDSIGNLSVMAQGQGLNMVLNVFHGPVVNAARTIAYSIQGAVIQFANNFLTAVNPQIIKYYAQGQVEDMMLLVRRSSIGAFLVLYMIMLPLSLEIHYVLSLWLGNYPAYTASFAVIVLVNELLNAFRRPRITIFHATGHIKLSNVVTGTILCLALPLGYVLMKLGYSPTAVFYGMLATTLMAEVSNLLILKRYIDYSIRGFLLTVHCKVLCIALLVSILPVFSHYIMPESFVRLAVVSLTSVVSVALCIWVVVLDRQSRAKVRNAVSNKLCKHTH